MYTDYIDIKKKYIRLQEQIGGVENEIISIGDIHGDLKLLIILLTKVTNILVPDINPSTNLSYTDIELNDIFNKQASEDDINKVVRYIDNEPKYEINSIYKPLFGYKWNQINHDRYIIFTGDYIDNKRSNEEISYPSG